MRKGWTDYVAKIRKRGNRGANNMTHQQAMKTASKTWPIEKAKLERKLKREEKRRSAAGLPEQKVQDSETGQAKCD